MASVNKVKGNGSRIRKDKDVINKKNSKKEIVEENVVKKEEVVSFVNTKRYFGYRDRLLARFILLFAMILLFSVSLYCGINVKSDNVYRYVEGGTINYKTYLVPNNYYNVPFLNEDMQYISDLVNYLDVDFNYDLFFSSKTKYSYNYYVTGDLYIYEGNTKDKLLYKKSYNVINPVQVNNEIGDNIVLNLNQKIDYKYYDNIAKSFTNQFGLITNSEIVFNFHVNVDSKSEFLDDDIRIEGLSVMRVPLNTKTMGVTLELMDSNNKEEFVKRSDNTSNIILFCVSFVCFVISVILVQSIVRFMLKTRSTKNNYQTTLDKILKEYDRAIITAKSDYIIKNVDNYIDVSSFLELMDVHDNLDLPILYIEIAKGQKVWFIINAREGTYRYVLKNID